MKSAVVYGSAIVLSACIAAVNGQAINADSILQAYDSLNPEHVHLQNAAVEYYQRLATPFPDLLKASFHYSQAVTRLRKAKAVEKTRQEVLKVLEKVKDSCKNQKSFLGDSGLKYQIIEYADMEIAVLKNDFGKILDMEDIKERTYDEDEAHQLAIDLAIEKLNTCIDLLNKVEENFFKKYHIKVNNVKDEMTVKIERADTVISYYNKVQRLYYKSNKEYYYARQSAGAKDIAGLEQHTAALLSFVQDGLEKIKQQTPFEGDGGLVASAKELLEFYLHEAQVNLPANVDFAMKTDNMQNADKKLRAIKERDRKKEDVDEFNNTVKTFNAAVNEINTANNNSFKRHRQLLAQWEKQKETFFKKHA